MWGVGAQPVSEAGGDATLLGSDEEGPQPGGRVPRSREGEGAGLPSGMQQGPVLPTSPVRPSSDI